ncbi:Lrp/AsnC ligand binding domain-containing protein [Aestuariivivens sediminis]|uniref:Lrp/AsnC ligand binding domain-containing protein n=1 Tax=Aestuariivivens sediminis TaxID=2913557 RepID=UPI001F5751B7|nr:Lrp/AsnC ligand binding domain-containing protein [Aestuariivivens sediminis]
MRQKTKSITIDGIDKKILRMLMKEARTPILEVARNVGISGAAIHQRLRKLEKAKLISGSQLIVNPEVLGYTTCAFVGVYLDKEGDTHTIIKLLHRIPEVLECHYTSGHWNLFLKVLCINNDHLIQLLNSLQEIGGVFRTESLISLNQEIDRQVKV